MYQSIGPWGAAWSPIRWRVGPLVVLISIIDMVLPVTLPAIELHLSPKQLTLISLLLPLINCIKPQVEVGQVVVHVLMELTSVRLLVNAGSYISFSGGIIPKPPATSSIPPPLTLPPIAPPWGWMRCSSDSASTSLS